MNRITITVLELEQKARAANLPLPEFKLGLVSRAELKSAAYDNYTAIHGLKEDKPSVLYWNMPQAFDGRLTPESFKQRFENGDSHVRGATLVTRLQVYRPYIAVASGRMYTLPTILGMAAAAVYCDILAEELNSYWMDGLFRYQWASPFTEHPNFNLTLDERALVRDTPIACAARRTVRLLADRGALQHHSQMPEDFQNLLRDIDAGVVTLVSERGRPRGSTDSAPRKARQSAPDETLLKRIDKLEKWAGETVPQVVAAFNTEITRLNVIAERLNSTVTTCQQLRAIAGTLAGEIEVEREINVSQTGISQTLIEQLAEVRRAVNDLIRVHRLEVSDEDGILRAEHRPVKPLNKLVKPMSPEPEVAETTEAPVAEEVKADAKTGSASGTNSKGVLFV